MALFAQSSGALRSERRARRSTRGAIWSAFEALRWKRRGWDSVCGVVCSTLRSWELGMRSCLLRLRSVELGTPGSKLGLWRFLLGPSELEARNVEFQARRVERFARPAERWAWRAGFGARCAWRYGLGVRSVRLRTPSVARGVWRSEPGGPSPISTGSKKRARPLEPGARRTRHRPSRLGRATERQRGGLAIPHQSAAHAFLGERPDNPLHRHHAEPGLRDRDGKEVRRHRLDAARRAPLHNAPFNAALRRNVVSPYLLSAAALARVTPKHFASAKMLVACDTSKVGSRVTESSLSMIL